MGALRGLKGHRTRPGSRGGHKAIIPTRGCEFWLPRELVLTPEGATSGPGEPETCPERVSPVIKGAISGCQRPRAELRRSRLLPPALSLETRIDSFLRHSCLPVVDNRCIGNNVLHRGPLPLSHMWPNGTFTLAYGGA
jgi:hypothetical protein